VSLAVDVDADGAAATYERGLLRIELPVAERAPAPARLTIAIRRVG
jgi:HSP20 family molecular chaperone IbpA